MTIKTLLHKCFTAIGIRKEKYYLFQIMLTKEKLQCNPLPESFIAIEVTSGNVHDFDFSLFAKKYDRFLDRLKNTKDHLYVVLNGQRVCYCTWVSFDSFIFPRYIKQTKKLQPDEGFIYDSACAEQYRGIGLHSHMNMFCLRKIFENGKLKALVLILENNTPAFKVQVKSGLKIIQEMRTFHCSWLGINKVTFTSH